MPKVNVLKQEETGYGWKFLVRIEENNQKVDYVVNLDNDYWLSFTKGSKEPKEIIKLSFEFLLARESKESILRKFNLSQIKDYFKEYESEIKKQL